VFPSIVWNAFASARVTMPMCCQSSAVLRTRKNEPGVMARKSGHPATKHAARLAPRAMSSHDTERATGTFTPSVLAACCCTNVAKPEHQSWSAPWSPSM